MEKTEIKETAFSLYLNTFFCVVSLIGFTMQERLGYMLFNLALAILMAVFAAQDYAKLQVLKAEKEK